VQLSSSSSSRLEALVGEKTGLCLRPEYSVGLLSFRKELLGGRELPMSNLKDRLEEFKRTFESGALPYNATSEIVATMHRATAELKASGIEGRALKIGHHAPEFALFNQDHVEISSKEVLRQGPLVVSFFRGHW
jgi:hypothetical protein